VTREEELSSREAFRADPQRGAEPLDERPTSVVAEEVADVRADGRAEESEQDHERDRMMGGSSPRRSKQQQGLAWKWNAGALDQDSQSSRRIAEGVNDRSPVQEPSYTGRPDARVRRPRSNRRPASDPAAFARATACCGPPRALPSPEICDRTGHQRAAGLLLRLRLRPAHLRG